jgi:hypothetical protein
MKKNNKVPSLNVHQKIMTKKTNFLCSFEDGIAKVKYDREDVAKACYERMKKSGSKCKIEGSIIFDYYPKKSAKEIYDLYKKDVEKGMTQNRRFVFNISYEEIK